MKRLEAALLGLTTVSGATNGLPLAGGGISVTQPSTIGNQTLFPPFTSFINYGADQTRATNAIVPLNDSGELGVRCRRGSGTVHFILGVNGYYQ